MYFFCCVFKAGRSDFLDAINENSVGSLDFGQLEALINGNSLQSSGIFPESPPDSGSEPYSPNYTTLQVLVPQPQPFPPDTVQSTLIEIENNVSIDEQLQTQTYQQQYLVKNGLLSPEMASTSLGVVVGGPSMVAVSPSQQQQHSPIPGFETVAPPGRLPSIIYPHTIPSDLANSEFAATVLPPTSSTTLSRKRKCTDTGDQSDEFTWPRSADQEMLSQDGELTAPSVGSNDSNDAVRPQPSKLSDSEAPMQNIKFQTFQKASWAVVCDQNLKESPLPQYRVNADKGFNFSVPDDSFVCQKKNHFQVTCHAHMQGAPAPVFVTTKTGLEKIIEFQLHFYGVKLEAPTQQIRIEQSQPDRTKRPYNPVKMDLPSGRPLKLSIGRLHFSETTANNMRKKGRPNPDQRYFQLVVGLHALTHSGNFPLISMASERIIVRASNPSQFDNVEVSMETPWSTGDNGCIYHNGMVGINTDRVEESLVVNGNIKVSGQILANSDVRAKQEICELDSKQQLQNIQKIRVVRWVVKF
jgi:NDT80 / PhoG like DNA-binding  family